MYNQSHYHTSLVAMLTLGSTPLQMVSSQIPNQADPPAKRPNFQILKWADHSNRNNCVW